MRAQSFPFSKTGATALTKVSESSSALPGRLGDASLPLHSSCMRGTCRFRSQKRDCGPALQLSRTARWIGIGGVRAWPWDEAA